MPTCAVTYSGSTPGADSNTYPLFSTVTAAPNARGLFQLADIKRFVLDLAHDQALTLKAYWSNDGGTNWNLYSSEAVAAPAAGVTRTRDYLVEHYRDWKLDAVNGGSAQATWILNMALSEQRSAAV